MKNKEYISTKRSNFGKYLTPMRKLRAEHPFFWDHHRGGWGYVARLIAEHLHAPDGVLYVSSVEHELWRRLREKEGPITEPWVGFMHQMPHHDLKLWDLERIVQVDIWKESIKHCLGLWTLTNYQKNFLQTMKVSVPIAKVYYPTELSDRNFSIEKFVANQAKGIFCIGKYLRNFQAFNDLEAPGYEKVLLKYREFDQDLATNRFHLEMNGSVETQGVISNELYDKLFEDSLVYLNLLDGGAVTTVLECIARGTPILINPVGGVMEYLGENYPLYCNTPEEATSKLRDTELIIAAAEYLKSHELKEKLTEEYFLASFQNTAIYRMLPVPVSQQKQFETVDVSIVMCAYNRIYNLEKQLTLLTNQDFKGTFEVLIWNNNIAMAEQVAEICNAFKDRLRLKVIHSSENFYCVIRMAVSSLIRSDLLLICDDDVLPQSAYISTFLAKYEEYGPNAVICVRGHVFLPHTLDQEHPERFWNKRESMKFYDESKPDRQLHFTHADNCLIPKSIMKRAMQYEMERYDFILVDDYWLSFVFSKHLGIPLWKIKGDDVLQFTECADDPSIAMFHNDLVNEQRVNFYVYHMAQGWPSGPLPDTNQSSLSNLPDPQLSEPEVVEISG